MGDAQFCLQWNSHNKNICHGLSYLQQNEEFVDMTLAADGHHVKVHQMVLALASPYIKELIVAANCPHPVIFLNKVSYKTMCSILEYIYLGESVVSVDDIGELLAAAKELHIKGLEDVKVADAPESTENNTNDQTMEAPEIQIKMLQPVSTPQISSVTSLKRRIESSARSSNVPLRKRAVLDISNEIENASASQNEVETDFADTLDDRDDYDDDDDDDTTVAVRKPEANTQSASLQYSVSKQGVLKLILNRYIYSKDHDYKGGRRRHWRCSNRTNKGCKANVVTEDNVVVRRIYNHNHPFHDRAIMRLVQAGKIFSTLPDAENLKQKQLGTERPDEPDNNATERPGERDFEREIDTINQTTEKPKINMLQPVSTPQISSVTSLKRRLESSARSSNVPLRKRAVLSKSNKIENSSALQKEVETYLFTDTLSDRDDYDDNDDDTTVAVRKPEANAESASLQYSVSKQGVLKLILNRYIYSKDHDYKDGRRRHWRCCNRSNKGCKANVVTEDNVVVRRIYNHNHPFHDRAIMRLVLAGKIFGTLPNAEDLKQKQLGTERPDESDSNATERTGERDSVSENKGHTESAATIPKGPSESRSGLAKAVIKVPCEPSSAKDPPPLDGISAPVHREEKSRDKTIHERRHMTKSPRGAGIAKSKSGNRSDKGLSREKRDMPFI